LNRSIFAFFQGYAVICFHAEMENGQSSLASQTYQSFTDDYAKQLNKTKLHIND
jgi:hypothetical protein